MTVLDKVAVGVWLAGVLLFGLAIVCMFRYPDQAGLHRLTVTVYRANPYVSAFVLALVALAWPVSVPLLRYMSRQGGGQQ